MRRRWHLLAAAALGLGAVLAADRLFPPDLARANTLGLAVAARDGTVLDVLESRDGYWRLPATVADVDPGYLRLLLRTEDKRFYGHPGIDPLAMARAGFQLATTGHVVSGGSTLTMQVARLLSPHRHTLAGKLYDMARALQLEARYSKPQILGLYLTLAPYGGNIEGVRAASLLYFGHSPAHLSPAEAALLVALPRSPARLRPDRHPRAAIAAAAAVLARAGEDPGLMAELPPLVRLPVPAASPHLAWRLRGERYEGTVRTTLEAPVQRALTGLAWREQPWLGAGAGIAALVVRNRDRAILGYLGGADFYGPGGMVDMVRAVRSPGSALKPFIYGMALADGLVVPGTLIADAPLQEGGYAPADFDRSFRGLVPVSTALQQSLNLPAVSLLRAIGPARFIAALAAAGVPTVLPAGAAPSLPVALGGLGITLENLAKLYAGLADGGAVAPLRLLAKAPMPDPVPLIPPSAAATVAAILRAGPVPDGVSPEEARPIAAKTGTSYGFRDAWAAGISADYTVVVWVGRVDGTPRPDVFARAAAAPLLYKIFDLLPPDTGAWPAPPPGLSVAALSPSLQVFGRAASPGQPAGGPRLKILFPPAGALLQAEDGGGAPAPIALEATGGAPPYRWMIDGAPLPAAPIGMSMSWSPPNAGFVHISVVDRRDDAVSEEVRLN